MFPEIAEIIEDKNNDVFIKDTDIEILDYYIFNPEDNNLKDKWSVLCVYLINRKTNKIGGICFSLNQLKFYTKEHIIDAFKLAVI